MNNLPPFEGLNMKIPIIIPMKRREFINHGCTLGFRVPAPQGDVVGVRRRKGAWVELTQDGFRGLAVGTVGKKV